MSTGSLKWASSRLQTLQPQCSPGRPVWQL
jgi:hypothetical protein